MDIEKNMEVLDANGQHVGIVDTVAGDQITLKEQDAIDPKDLTIDMGQVARVEQNKVFLSQQVSAITTRAFVSRNS